MFIVAAYRYGHYLELAITDLEKRGIARNQIGTIILDERVAKRQFFDTLHRSDGVSLLDSAAITGTIGMLLGTIYGFELTWGPILWGLTGLGLGALLGFLLDNLRSIISSIKALDITRNKISAGDSAAEVILIIECKPAESGLFKQVLWNNQALGIGQLRTPE